MPGISEACSATAGVVPINEQDRIPIAGKRPSDAAPDNAGANDDDPAFSSCAVISRTYTICSRATTGTHRGLISIPQRGATMKDPVARSMSSQLFVRIRERILTGEYKSGTQLLQDSLAAEFGVSKIPLREALVQLCSDGLLDFYAHRGFQVRPTSLEEMQEVFRLRLNLEPDAVAHGARVASAKDREVAREALAAEQQALTAKGQGYSGDLNSAFHLALIVPRVQPVTKEVLQRLYTICERYVRMHVRPPGRQKRSYKEHVELHDAWAAGQAKEAERLVRDHITEIRDDLSKTLSE